MKKLKHHTILLRPGGHGPLKILEDILPSLEANGSKLVIATFGKKGPLFDPSSRSLLESYTLPILLLPQHLAEEDHEFWSLLVPLTGEPSYALEYGIELAKKTDLPLEVVHITPASSNGGSFIDQVYDQFHHEYPHLIEELIHGSYPYLKPEDRRLIRRISHVLGRIAEEIIRYKVRRKKSLLILEWKGDLQAGKAKTLKSTLEKADFPFLIVRQAPPQLARLKVGDLFRTNSGEMNAGHTENVEKLRRYKSGDPRRSSG